MTFESESPSGEAVVRAHLARAMRRRRKGPRAIRGLLLAVVLAGVAIGALWLKRAPPPRSASALAPQGAPALEAPPPANVLTAAPLRSDDVVGTTPPSTHSPAGAEPPAAVTSKEPETIAAATPAPPSPPDPVKPAQSRPSEETRQFVAKARAFIAQGDVTTARLFLERAADHGDAEASFALGETYDPLVLTRWKARGVSPDIDKARALYARALQGGVVDASKRLAELVGK